MEVKIIKEIRNYQESIFFGLNVRQLFCSIMALAVAVGLYFGLAGTVGTEEVGWMCILGAAPFAACGFFKYHGMPAERFFLTWFKFEILFPKRLVFKAENLYAACLSDAIERGERAGGKERIGKTRRNAID